MIIIEGLNGTGKTALAKKLCKDLDFEIHKFLKIPATQEEFDQQVQKSISLIDKPVIQDRCPMISEPIYGTYNRDELFMSLSVGKKIILKHKPILIWTDTLHPKPRRRLNYVEKIVKSYSLFFMTLKWSKSMLLLWNYATIDYDYFLKYKVLPAISWRKKEQDATR